MYKEMKKNRSLINPFHLNAKQTRKWRRIYGFCRSIIFYGKKNVRVDIFLFGLGVYNNDMI
jgi:hypothetical protein